MNKITSKIYLSDYWGAFDKEILLKEGITAILICGLNLKPFHPKDFIYYIIPINDYEDEDITRYFSEVLDFLSKNSKILIHCQMGISRSASFVILYLMNENKISYQEAFEFVKEKRSIIQPNLGFVRQLKKFEEILLNSKI